MDLLLTLIPLVTLSLTILSVYVIEKTYERNSSELIRDFDRNICIR